MSKEYADAHPYAYGELASAFWKDQIEIVYDPGGPSMTRQEFVAECDINELMSRYEKHGVWPLPPNGVEPLYYDFTTMPEDLQGYMNIMMDAEDAFMKLPARVRKEFDNDPVRFVEFAADGGNLEQMREWGLAAPVKAPEPPMRVEVVNPPEADREPGGARGVP